MLGCLINKDCAVGLEEVVSRAENPVIVTDPPFNVGYHYDEYGDRMEEDAYYAFLARLMGMCPRCVVVHYPEALYRLAAEMGRVPSRVVSWVYNSNTPRHHRDIAYFGVEPDFAGLGEYKNPMDRRIAARIADGKKPIGYDWIYHDQVKNVSAEKCGHPCQMPLAVMLYVVRTLPKDATVIDPFAGSGTTLLAAKRTGRSYVGFEISTRYYKIARARLAWDSPLFEEGWMGYVGKDDIEEEGTVS